MVARLTCVGVRVTFRPEEKENTGPLWTPPFKVLFECTATETGKLPESLPLLWLLRPRPPPAGIRPAFYFQDDELLVVCSERAAIQAVFHKPPQDIKVPAPRQTKCPGTPRAVAARQGCRPSGVHILP